tara:strand:+ start:255 stop:500 length:246 start_codon:yes stop_codon:yes gene_type:complete
MTRQDLINNYKSDRNIKDSYKLNDDENYLIDKLLEAINYKHCCEIDSEQFSFADMRDAFDYASVSSQRRDGMTFKEWMSKR